MLEEIEQLCEKNKNLKQQEELPKIKMEIKGLKKI